MLRPDVGKRSCSFRMDCNCGNRSSGQYFYLSNDVTSFRLASVTNSDQLVLCLMLFNDHDTLHGTQPATVVSHICFSSLNVPPKILLFLNATRCFLLHKVWCSVLMLKLCSRFSCRLSKLRHSVWFLNASRSFLVQSVEVNKKVSAPAAALVT